MTLTRRAWIEGDAPISLFVGSILLVEPFVVIKYWCRSREFKERKINLTVSFTVPDEVATLTPLLFTSQLLDFQPFIASSNLSLPDLTKWGKMDIN